MSKQHKFLIFVTVFSVFLIFGCQFLGTICTHTHTHTHLLCGGGGWWLFGWLVGSNYSAFNFICEAIAQYMKLKYNGILCLNFYNLFQILLSRTSTKRLISRLKWKKKKRKKLTNKFKLNNNKLPETLELLFNNNKIWTTLASAHRSTYFLVIFSYIRCASASVGFIKFDISSVLAIIVYILLIFVSIQSVNLLTAFLYSSTLSAVIDDIYRGGWREGVVYIVNKFKYIVN